jgi:hypothetical protein
MSDVHRRKVYGACGLSQIGWEKVLEQLYLHGPITMDGSPTAAPCPCGPGVAPVIGRAKAAGGRRSGRGVSLRAAGRKNHRVAGGVVVPRGGQKILRGGSGDPPRHAGGFPYGPPPHAGGFPYGPPRPALPCGLRVFVLHSRLTRAGGEANTSLVRVGPGCTGGGDNLPLRRLLRFVVSGASGPSGRLDGQVQREGPDILHGRRSKREHRVVVSLEGEVAGPRRFQLASQGRVFQGADEVGRELR